MKHLAAGALAVALASGFAADLAHAQLITGRLILESEVEGEVRGVEGAEIQLLSSAAARVTGTVSDSAGFFSLSVPEPGAYLIEATRIGLARVRANVEVGEREIVELELTTSERAIPLQPLVVIARRQIRKGTLDEFYDRMERMKRRGQGHFLTREDLERMERRSLPLALATAPGVLASPSGGAGYDLRLSGPGGPCTPDIYLDGLPLDGSAGHRAFEELSPGASGLYPFGDAGGEGVRRGYAGIPVLDLEGVEIYRGRFERADDYWPSTCGIIFLWRKRDWGNPFGWTRLFIAGGLTAGIFLILM